MANDKKDNELIVYDFNNVTAETSARNCFGCDSCDSDGGYPYECDSGDWHHEPQRSSVFGAMKGLSAINNAKNRVLFHGKRR